MAKLIFTKKDFKIDTYRASGHGGQNVNKRETAIRITHIETGITTTCQEYRAQGANRKKAFQKMKELLQKHYNQKTNTRFAAGNKVIRTYNEHDDRVRDHETGKQYPYKQTIGKGNISEIIDERAKDKANEKT